MRAALTLLILLLTGLHPGLALADKAAAAPTEELHLRAQLKARQSTLISSEMNARINQLTLHDGERFSAGQTLVSFHCTLEEAQLSKTQATFDKKLKTHEVDQRLANLHSIGVLELAVAKAEAEEAKADVQVARAILERCAIKAPFAGKVSEIIARPYQSVRVGDPLMEIQGDKNLEVEFMAPSRVLLQLTPKKHFRVTLEETGKTYPAEITRLGGKVDPVSQTIKVYGRIIDSTNELLPGMSGAVELNTLP
jgi:RND family efflux transporter MFP subunit